MSSIDEGNFGVFLILTVILGGGAAFMSGRALAKDWRPVGYVFFYMALLAAGVRFLNFALFERSLFSLKFYAIAYIILLAFSLLGYRLKRVAQMVNQYPWIYERSGLFFWRNIP